MTPEITLFDKFLLARADSNAGATMTLAPHVTVDYQGVPLVGVVHCEDTVRLLWNAGHLYVPPPINTADPMEAYAGAFRPFAHQRSTAGFMTVYADGMFCLNGMGTGKTASAIWATRHLRKTGQVKRTLILCPLSCMRPVWRNELNAIDPMATQQVAHGDATKRKRAIGYKPDYIIMNHDGVKTAFDLLKEDDFDHIIVDEATAFKCSGGKQSERFKALQKLRAGRKLWLMTGTPMPKSPTDVWALCRLVCPERVPEGFTTWEAMTTQKVSNFRRVPVGGATSMVYSAMQPAIRIAKDDVLDLPPVTMTAREVPLTKAQSGAIDDLRNHMFVDASKTGQDKVSVPTAGALATKIRQVAQGAVLDDSGSAVVVDTQPRYKETLDLIQQNDGKFLIFASYIACAEKLHAWLKKQGLSVALVHGGVSEKKRAEHYASLQHGTDLQGIVAQPGTMAHGLTLTAANLTIWFGTPNGPEEYLQANERTNRPGQKSAMTVARLYSTREERDYYKRLDGEITEQEYLLGLYA